MKWQFEGNIVWQHW